MILWMAFGKKFLRKDGNIHMRKTNEKYCIFSDFCFVKWKIIFELFVQYFSKSYFKLLCWKRHIQLKRKFTEKPISIYFRFFDIDGAAKIFLLSFERNSLGIQNKSTLRKIRGNLGMIYYDLLKIPKCFV